MANIGRPTSDEPLQVPAPWEWPEPKRETTPEPERKPEQVPAGV